MKRVANYLSLLPSIVVALFVAWLERAFEDYHVPSVVAEYHKQPDAAAPGMDDGDQAQVNLTVPPAPSMPIGNRWVNAGPQPLGGILPAFRARGG
jgi:hypothetical protein